MFLVSYFRTPAYLQGIRCTCRRHKARVRVRICIRTHRLLPSLLHLFASPFVAFFRTGLFISTPALFFMVHCWPSWPPFDMVCTRFALLGGQSLLVSNFCNQIYCVLSLSFCYILFVVSSWYCTLLPQVFILGAAVIHLPYS